MLLGSPARRDAELAPWAHLDVDCYMDAFQVVLPDVTRDEAIAWADGWRHGRRLQRS
jgi:hypothetical protein